MTTYGQYVKPGYFTKFELARLKLNEDGQIMDATSGPADITIIGFVFIRSVLVNILVKKLLKGVQIEFYTKKQLRWFQKNISCACFCLTSCAQVFHAERFQRPCNSSTPGILRQVSNARWTLSVRGTSVRKRAIFPGR